MSLQTPAVMFKSDDYIDYTPIAAVTGGDVVLIGNIPAVATHDIAAGVLGALAVRGVLKVPKDTVVFAPGDTAYWNPNGSPNVGTVNTGACNATAAGNYLMGVVILAAATGDAYAYVLLTAYSRTATLGGAVVADSLTGDLATLTIAGLAAAAGGAISVTGGTSSGANAGGAITITGGTGGASQTGGALTLTAGVPVSGNAAGGAYVGGGGAGLGTGAGGATASRGGASGAGATGNGGSYTAGGGAALSVNGSGGASTFTSGVATGNGTGGALNVTSGASAGASGTAGAINIDTGAAAGGTAGAITIGGTNATSVTIGSAGNHTVIAGPQTETIGASTAAAGTTTADAAVLPAGTVGVYPTTAADGTKGVRAHASDKVTGRILMIGNGISNQALKVYPVTGGTINGAGADVAFVSATGKGVILVCLNSAANTWLAW